MSNLLKSLRKSTTVKIIKASKEHMRKAAECVMTLKAAFKQIKKGNHDVALEKFDAVSNLENQADELRRSILLDLTSSEIDHTTREALAHLIKNVDRIANTANGAGRIFAQIPKKYLELITKDLDIVLNMLDKSVEATKLLINLVDEMVGKRKNIDSINAKIQELEHDCDVFLADIFKDFLEMDEPSISPFVAIQLTKGVNFIESISDAVEDTADYIKVLTIRTA
ncbi:MAG: DUF47 domain-containing protein [Candidatus Hodarchaeota archaeon]